MWSPTHIKVTVKEAKGLLCKGKNGTNNCFVTIALGKEKYQTSVKEKADMNVNWHEECELKIPDQGNRAELVLTCLHRNNLGLDEFLGQVTLPLNEMDVYDRPRSKWFKLESKPGKEKKNKERGELEVRICFVVKSGSLTDLSKKDKHKSSIGQLASSVGGSLLSIGTIEKRKGIKKFAKSLGSKMHLHSKKKNKEGDDTSINGSFASIGTPNSSTGGSRRYGQSAGEADPGVISEDEDEFVFDNLSHKSSGSSLNVRSSLQPPTPNFVPRNPSPLLGTTTNGKAGGKQLSKRNFDEDLAIDPELEEIENDFSVRTRTLPPPSKPPRTPQLGTETTSSPNNTKEQKFDEWESKLYGGKHLDIGSTDSLKRRSWELARVPLPTANEEPTQQEAVVQTETKTEIAAAPKIQAREHDSSDSSSSSEAEEEVPSPQPPTPIAVKTEPKLVSTPNKPQELGLNAITVTATATATVKPTTHNIGLLSPDVEQQDFNKFNASFAKFEQRNSAKIFEMNAEKAWRNTKAAITIPQALPRNRDKEAEMKKAEEEALQRQTELKLQEQEQKRRAEEDARLEAELHLNEQRLQEEEKALKEELRQQEEQKRREAKRREEDQKILNFAKRSTSTEDDEHSLATPEQSPKMRVVDKREKRLNKFKFFSKRDKAEDDSSSSSPKSTERIILGHEAVYSDRRSGITAALAKKYEGKSREELMLIANGMENEALLQRQRVKELEDYLDNLLLRVMETHPKILQNPYSRTTSAKSFKNYIDMNDFL